MSDFPPFIHLIDVSTHGKPQIEVASAALEDSKIPDGFDGPEQGYRAVSDPRIDWERLARSQAHPVQILILETLVASDEPMSPTLLVPITKASLGTTSYHVKQLAEAGLVEITHTVPRRGALEHFYRVVES